MQQEALQEGVSECLPECRGRDWKLVGEEWPKGLGRLPGGSLGEKPGTLSFSFSDLRQVTFPPYVLVSSSVK